MANSQPTRKKSFVTSPPILFFTSFLLLVLVLFVNRTKSLDFDIFHSPFYYRDRFSPLISSSSAAFLSPPPLPEPGSAFTNSAPTLESTKSKPSNLHIDSHSDAQLAQSPESPSANTDVDSIQLSESKLDNRLVADEVESEIPIATGGESSTAQNLDPSPAWENGFETVTISDFKQGREANNGVELPAVDRLESLGFDDKKNCNLYAGKWVKDDNNYPVYKPGSCPYVDEAFNCQGNGRPDTDYLNWRWQPDGCDLPRFNATDFLWRLRGKRMMLVGDSMNRNEFESMLCLLREGLADKSSMYETHGYRITKGRGFYIFKFKDFNCTVEFIRSHFLVKQGAHTLSIDKIDKSSRKWKRADILIFNTGHWWNHGKTAKGKNYYMEGDRVYPRFDVDEAYKRALTTWGNWIDKNLNPAKQLVFYRAYSTAHYRGGDWDSGGSCNGETQPVLSGAILDSYPLKMKIVEEVIQKMKTPVVLLNVTKLSNFRKDSHPSIYGKNATAGVKVSRRRQDCSHWCLPGVPDAWNELIYASLVYQQIPSSTLL